MTVTATQAATGTYKGSTSTMTLTINDVNRCLESPCLNGGLCNRVVPASYTCTCAVGFGGPSCATPLYSIGGTVS